MKTRTGYDNVEMKQFILDRLAQVEYTDTYVFAIRHQGMIKAAKVEHAMDILPLVSYCEKQASSHGAPWGVRMWPRRLLKSFFPMQAKFGRFAPWTNSKSPIKPQVARRQFLAIVASGSSGCLLNMSVALVPKVALQNALSAAM